MRKILKKQLREQILANAHSLSEFGLNDLIWKKVDAIVLIRSILEEKIGIYGGDVYRIKNKKPLSLGDNWFCSPKENEEENVFFLRSKLMSLDYISSYNSDNDSEIVFSIVFTETITLPTLDSENRTALVIDEEWLLCPNCNEAWESTLNGATVICPNCDNCFLNPRQRHGDE